MEKINSIDFRLQAFEQEIIITVLVDNTPLYDCIVCKHTECSFTNEQEKATFIVESYHFSIYASEDVKEEELFYYNFPENVMPLDPKHDMIGLSVHETFAVLFSPFMESNVFNFAETELTNNREMIEGQGLSTPQVLCLVHTCGSTVCGHVTMNLELSEDGQYVNMHSFTNSFGFQYHPDVKYKFERAQYLNLLKKLQHLCNTTKHYQDYCKFESERFYKENAHLFESDKINNGKKS